MSKSHHSLVYLHGFDSSPASVKAQQVRAYLGQHYPQVEFICPQLTNLPEQALSLAEQAVIHALARGAVSVLGSSMGGFYATYLAEKYRLPAVLINPAVAPDRLLLRILGPHQHPHSGEWVVLTEQHVAQLRQQEVEISHPELFRVYLQTGDEVLDYRLAEKKYAACGLTIQPGGDHSFQRFDTLLAEVMEFLLTTRL